MSEPLTFLVGDLSSAEARAFIARHRAGMHEHSPPERVHALGVEELRRPEVTFWSAWLGDDRRRP